MVVPENLNDFDRRVCIDFAQVLRHHGIDVPIEMLPETAWHEQVFVHHDYDITFVTWNSSGCDISSLFSMNQGQPGGNNIVQFKHEALERGMTDFHHSRSYDEQSEIGRRLHAVLHEECPYVFLWSLYRFVAYRSDRIRDIGCTEPDDVFSGIEEWEIYPDRE